MTLQQFKETIDAKLKQNGVLNYKLRINNKHQCVDVFFPEKQTFENQRNSVRKINGEFYSGKFSSSIPKVYAIYLDEATENDEEMLKMLVFERKQKQKSN